MSFSSALPENPGIFVRPAEGNGSPGASDSSAPPHLLHVFASFGSGGVPIRITEMINRLGGEFCHSIVALDGNEAAKSRLGPDAAVTFMRISAKRLGILGRFRHHRAALRRIRPDLLLTYNWGAIEWAAANAFAPICPHLHFESGFGPEESASQIRRRVWFRRLALARTFRVVVPSRVLFDLAREVWRLDPEKLHYIPNGVDLQRFAPSVDVDPLFRDLKRPGEILVGTVAPLRPEKNVGRLLRVFASLQPSRHLRLVIAGDGSERALLESAASELGISDQVVFLGHVEAPEKLLTALDIFALSSDTEQMPNALLQAMASARPVAGVDVGDVKLILAPENRPLIAPREDEAAFARSLSILIEDAGLRERLGQRNRDHVVRHYRQNEMAARYREIYRAALQHPDARHAASRRAETRC